MIHQMNIRGKFGFKLRRFPGAALLAVIKCRHGQLHFSHWSRNGGSAQRYRRLLVVRPLPHQAIESRGAAMFVGKILKNILKIRYLLLGGAVGGGYTFHQKVQEWMDAIPDTKWIKDYIPDNERFDSFRAKMITFKDKLGDFEIDPRLKQFSESRLDKVKDWFDRKLDEAVVAANEQEQKAIQIDTKLGTLSAASIPSEMSGGGRYSKEQYRQAEDKINELKKQLTDMQLKYEFELMKLEKENKQLRQNLLLKRALGDTPKKEAQRSLIDMYSEVLDELSGYDANYQAQDHLPRVVVVGDQSAGKTSVLEMIAMARIFPRGAGEMMTRAPVKVTLSEGPYHIAQFRDSDREYDLTKESDLQELRNQVEQRMMRSVIRTGKTVSNDVISMTVKGPGLQRMVLVDLPGIISTVTRDMASDTGDAIKKMTQLYMANPNAIILCIQDGSVDAERSNVTDLVSQVDPQGKRTIFVLTKVDLAEENLAKPERVKKILAGELFPMKALGYFAVVTGRGRKDDSIQSIQEYEEDFFRKSKLFQNLSITSQVTTRNLSRAVADRFWKMVKETVEQQADSFKATRFNLETEWKNNFPRLRELDRDELFEKARSEILDEIVNLSEVSVKQWEELLINKIWEKVSSYVFEHIYLSSAQANDMKMFNTKVDIKLRQWANEKLPKDSVDAGWQVLKEEFTKFTQRGMNDKNHDNIFDELKKSVLEDAVKKHVWEDKANNVLRVMQLNILEDRCIRDKHQWKNAVTFLENSVKDELKAVNERLHEMVGPGTREKWLYWKYSTEDQNKKSAVKSELEKILYSNRNHNKYLSDDELTTIRNNLQLNDTNVDNQLILTVWEQVYRRNFLNLSLARAYDCRKSFYLYHEGLESEVECSDVVLFWRIEQMLKITANALRQQVMNREAQRLDKEIKEVLEEYSRDPEKKRALLQGRRVELAEELKHVKRIQEKLEEFIQALNKEKKEY
ncbi:LOW QUALITY PROTEIN: dynamin-like 120 kDa protein, mitochondrial [Nilaparvata lugens]|uniref:LOW QUALITY PROTEIN: dynamin-like 120 kDa protein, mitochondrial n=1 Tax=Nilaparvata lugens TaxID=108931 RepID=UPI00193E42BB|nr:LOW QUALITY PROTEIN: dynamin-like 120 kDa protein, mitochondrial [Nilaparvata lugens]